MIKNWREIDLGCLTSYQKGYAFKSAWYVEEGTSVVRVSDTTDNSIETDRCNKIKAELALRYQKYVIRYNDIIIATVGSWPPNYSSVVGKVVKVPVGADGSLLNQNAVRLRSSSIDLLNQLFLYYSMKSNRFFQYIINCSQGSANQASIKLTDIFNYKLLLPNIKEQKAIASILSSLDDKIELNLQMNKTLESMTMALYKHWFVDFGPFQDGEFVDSELGKIPKGWEVKKLGELLVNIRKNKIKENILDDEKYVGLQHIDKGSLSLFNYGYGHEVTSNKSSFKKNDILFGKLRPYFKKIIIAPFDGICSTDILVLNSKVSSDFGFVLFTIFNDRFIDYTSVVSSGTRMPRVGWKAIENYRVAVECSRDLTSKFNSHVESIVEQIIINVTENQTLTKLRDTLLPKLISGEVRVKDIEKTIASVL